MYSQNSKSTADEGRTFCIGHIYSVNFAANAERILKGNSRCGKSKLTLFRLWCHTTYILIHPVAKAITLLTIVQRG
jgi:hypothetical protein